MAKRTEEEEREYRREIKRRFYLRHRERLLAELRDKYRSDPKRREHLGKVSAQWKADNPEQALLQSCRQNARKRGGQLCDLTLEQMKELCAPMVCSVTGIKLAWGGGPWAPSIDRRDNGEGYTRSNVRLTCWAYNSMRGEWDDETVLTVALSLASMQRNTAA